MESEEHQEMWPVIGQSDVDDICRKICESIVELERAFEAGELSSKLTSGCFEQVLGPPLYEIYGKLAENAPGPLHHLRVDAVDALLAQLQNDLIPTQVAHAELRMPPEGDPWAAEPGTDSPPNCASNSALRARPFVSIRCPICASGASDSGSRRSIFAMHLLRRPSCNIAP